MRIKQKQFLLALVTMFVAVPDVTAATNVSVSASDRVSTLGNKYYKMYYVVTGGTEYPVYMNGNYANCSNSTATTAAVFYFSAADANNFYHISLAGTDKYWHFDMNKGLSTTSIGNVQIFNSTYNTGLYWICLLDADGNMASRAVLAQASKNATLNYNSRAWNGNSGKVSVGQASATGWNSEVKLVEVFPVDITYTFKCNGNIVATESMKGVVGDPFPAPAFTAPYGFTYTAPSGNITAAGNVNIDVVSDGTAFPFEFATDVNDAKWYTWKMANRTTSTPAYKGFVSYDSTAGLFLETDLDEQPKTAEYLYTFIGTPFGFTMMTADGKFIYTSGTNISNIQRADSGAVLTVRKSNTSGWKDFDHNMYFSLKNDFSGSLNEMSNSPKRKIVYWASGGVNDNGSLIAVQPADVIVYPIAFQNAPAGSGVVINGDTVLANAAMPVYVAEDGVNITSVNAIAVEGCQATATKSGRVITVAYEASTPAYAKTSYLQPAIDAAKASYTACLSEPQKPGWKRNAELKGAYETAVAVMDDESAEIPTIKTAAEALTAANTSYTTAPAIIMPEAGKHYTFRNKNSNLSKNFTLYANGNKLGIANDTDMGSSQVFRCDTVGGKYIFVNMDNGLYLVWRDKNGAGYNSNNGFAEYNAQYCKWTFVSDYATQPGVFYFWGARANGNPGSIIINMSTGNFDGWGNTSSGTRTDYCNLYFVEEVPMTGISFDIPLTTVGDYTYATACYPFDAQYTGAEVYTLDLASEFNCKPVTDGLVKANVAVILRSTNSKATVTAVDSIKCEQTSDLVGTSINMEVSANSVLTLGINEGTPGFFTYTGTAIAAHKGYLPNSLSAKKVSLNFGGETVIKSINVDANVNDIYNLYGQKIQKLQNGINIVNGKKVYIKK